MIDFISLGEQSIPGVPLRCLPLAEANAPALYQRRLEAMRSCTQPYLCFVDGKEDICLPGFVEAMYELAHQGQALGYGRELQHGREVRKPRFTLKEFIRDHTIIHHGVVCNVESLMNLEWPDQGCYAWEVLAYGQLATQTSPYDPVAHYDWRPGPGGARRWPSFNRAVFNAKAFLLGKTGTHFKSDRV